MVSKSGVSGSRYGFVVLIKETTQQASDVSGRGIQGMQQKGLTLLRNFKPHGIVVKCVLVRVESFQVVIIRRAIAVHGSIVLVTEDDARAWRAFSRRLAALPADGLLLVTFELPLATRQATRGRLEIRAERGVRADLPSRS